MTMLTKNGINRFYFVLHRHIKQYIHSKHILQSHTSSSTSSTIVETCSELELVLDKKELEFSRLHAKYMGHDQKLLPCLSHLLMKVQLVRKTLINV